MILKQITMMANISLEEHKTLKMQTLHLLGFSY